MAFHEVTTSDGSIVLLNTKAVLFGALVESLVDVPHNPLIRAAFTEPGVPKPDLKLRMEKHYYFHLKEGTVLKFDLEEGWRVWRLLADTPILLDHASREPLRATLPGGMR